MADPRSGTRDAKRNAIAKTLDLPEDTLRVLEGALRTVLELVVEADWPVLRQRIGIEHGRADLQALPLFVEIAAGRHDVKALAAALADLGLVVADFWFRELEARDPADGIPAVIPAQLPLATGDPGRTLRGASLTQQLQRIAQSPFVARLRLASAHPKNVDRALDALDWPVPSSIGGRQLTGRGIVIGIVDEGCAFAHHDFLIATGARGATLKTRVLKLWDQSRAPSAAEQALGWTSSGVPYGREIDAAALNAAIGSHTTRGRVDEDAVYARLGYTIGGPAERATHGTMVMGLAAGNGRAAMARRGVAPEADLIFVHLPPVDADVNGSALGNRIADAAAYVFDRARALGKAAAVVNVSYGGYRGAHDGTNAAELAFDMLLAQKNRAIVVSAGNGFESDCHATLPLAAGASVTLDWQLPPEDPTSNDIEIWYDAGAAIEVTLRAPDGTAFGPFGFEAVTLQRPVDGKLVGRYDHTRHDPRNGDNVALIALRPTVASVETAKAAPAPSGRWRVELRHASGAPATVHAWIQRDDLGGPGERRQQSRFVRTQAHPGVTIGDLASGRRTIAVGAFNSHTGEVCRYSACGPTRASAGAPMRVKPEVMAPAEDAVPGLLASASGRAQPRRFNGTSAAAPQVTGVVALVFDYARHQRNIDLDTATLRAALAGRTQPLRPNRHLDADDTRPVKHADVMQDLIGVGGISLERTLERL